MQSISFQMNGRIRLYFQISIYIWKKFNGKFSNLYSLWFRTFVHKRLLLLLLLTLSLPSVVFVCFHFFKRESKKIVAVAYSGNGNSNYKCTVVWCMLCVFSSIDLHIYVSLDSNVYAHTHTHVHTHKRTLSDEGISWVEHKVCRVSIHTRTIAASSLAFAAVVVAVFIFSFIQNGELQWWQQRQQWRQSK